MVTGKWTARISQFYKAITVNTQVLATSTVTAWWTFSICPFCWPIAHAADGA